MRQRISRFVQKTIKWLSLALLAVLFIVVAINSRDEPLNEELHAIIFKPHAPIPDQDNIYIAMLGFTALQGEDFIATGRKRINEQIAASEKDPSGVKRAIEWSKKDGENTTGDKERSIEFGSGAVKIINSCDAAQDEQKYLTCVLEKKETIRQLIVNNKTLLDRYKAMQKMPAYDAGLVLMDPVYSPFQYSPILSTSNLLRQNAILDILEKRTEAGLQYLEQDMDFWRTGLRGKSNLLDSMIIRVGFLNNARAINALLASADFDAEFHRERLLHILQPLSQDESSLSNALDGETRFTHATGERMHRYYSYAEIREFHDLSQEYNSLGEEGQSVWGNWLSSNIAFGLFFQPNASSNRNLEYVKAHRNLASLPRCDYRAQRDAVVASFEHHVSSIPLLDWIYNPTGKILFERPNKLYYASSIDRMHDLNTYMQLLRMQLAIRLNHVKAEEIPAFIAKYGKQDSGFCPGEAFRWNPETRTLSFTPYDKNFIKKAKPEARVPVFSDVALK